MSEKNSKKGKSDMNTSDTNYLTDAEKYSLWCEKIRSLFTSNKFKKNVEKEKSVNSFDSSKNSNELDDINEIDFYDHIDNSNNNNNDATAANNDDGDDNNEFPFCFYMRMLSDGKNKSGKYYNTLNSHDFNENMNSRSNSSNSSSSNFSSISQQKLYLDEDALAARLAFKLSTKARAIRSEQLKQISPAHSIVRSSSLQIEEERNNIRWPFRDVSVEAIASTVNQELHEMLMYVRNRNKLSEQLRQQLVQTKLLLLQQKETSI